MKLISSLLLFCALTPSFAGAGTRLGRHPGSATGATPNEPRASTPFGQTLGPDAGGAEGATSGEPLHDRVRRLLGDHDYQYPPADYDAKSQAAETGALVFDAGLVTYTAFDGAMYQRRRFNGLYTALLLPQSDVDRLGLGRIRNLVDEQDLLYAHFRELTGREPNGEGLLSVAVATTCGFGCGYVGAKGIEFDPGMIDLIANPSSQDPNLYRAVLAHELAHNYDHYSSYVFVGPDAAHAWTSMTQYVLFYDRTGSTVQPPQDILQGAIDSQLGLYLNYPGANWATCVRDAACDPDGPETGVGVSNGAQGGAMLRVAQLHGSAAVGAWLAALRAEIATIGDPGSLSPEQKSDLFIRTLSYGTSHDLSCYFDAWGWPISPAVRSELMAAYGPNPFCMDSDGDGFTPFDGDLNDHSAVTRPGAVEVMNGVDDDCNGTVDDLLFTESADVPGGYGGAMPVPVPARIRGQVSTTSDEDRYSILLSQPTLVSFSLESLGSFAGWLFLYQQGPAGGWQTYFYVSAGGRGQLVLGLGAGRWDFSVAYNTASAVGQYEARVKVVEQWQSLPVDTAARIAPNQYLLKSPPVPASLGAAAGLMVRFWVSGVGFVGTVPATPGGATQFPWSVPAGFSPAGHAYRAEFVASGAPAYAISLLGWFAALDTPGVHSPTSSVWFLRNANSAGPADVVFGFGPAGAGWTPLTGDWDGDGVDTPGLYAPSSSTFFLKNTAGPGPADMTFSYGPAGAGWVPIVGDWDADGQDTVGLYAPSSSAFFLRNQHAPGPADLVYSFGPAAAGGRPLVGDWNGDGKDTVGLYMPASRVFFLKNTHAPGAADAAFGYGPAGATPLAGDWNADGKDTVGVYVGASRTFFLRNTNSAGAADFVFGYGPPGMVPVVGDWDGM